MNRNKKVNLLHDMTGCSFKQCRAALKRSKWDENVAIAFILCGKYPDISEALANVAAAICDTLARISDGLSEAIKNFSFSAEKMAAYYNNYSGVPEDER